MRDALEEMERSHERFRRVLPYRLGWQGDWEAPRAPRVWKPLPWWDREDLTRGIEALEGTGGTVAECRHPPTSLEAWGGSVAIVNTSPRTKGTRRVGKTRGTRTGWRRWEAQQASEAAVRQAANQARQTARVQAELAGQDGAAAPTRRTAVVTPRDAADAVAAMLETMVAGTPVRVVRRQLEAVWLGDEQLGVEHALEVEGTAAACRTPYPETVCRCGQYAVGWQQGWGRWEKLTHGRGAGVGVELRAIERAATVA
jgi:hypothetical protein